MVVWIIIEKNIYNLIVIVCEKEREIELTKLLGVRYWETFKVLTPNILKTILEAFQYLSTIILWVNYWERDFP